MRLVHPVWGFEELLEYFEQHSGLDVSETDLLRYFFPEENVFAGGMSLELFEKHFLLYRRLWLFDDELRAFSGQRLWIRSIRSTLLEPPERGRCDWLHPETGNYCLEPLPCLHHNNLYPELNSMKSYYWDWSNLQTMTPERLKGLMNGFFRWAASAPSRTEALALFELPATATPAEVRRRWKDLCKKNHPDRGGDLEVFQRLSAAWDLLKPDQG